MNLSELVYLSDGSSSQRSLLLLLGSAAARLKEKQGSLFTQSNAQTVASRTSSVPTLVMFK